MLTFADALRSVQFDPAKVRLLRHQDTRYPGQPSPYILWRDDRSAFEAYQRTQSTGNAAKLRAPYWASFVGLPDKSTLFAGLYKVKLIDRSARSHVDPAGALVELAGADDDYEPSQLDELQEYSGRLLIDWGQGYRSWIQRADSADKLIVELRREFKEEAFPGFDRLIIKLSQLETLPRGWLAALSATKGIYLLTCPRTHEQYVGSATGSGGFLQRWHDYAITRHGGNIALKGREPSDYQVSILETAGSGDSEQEIISLESLWKAKLQSQEMGLNRN